MTEPISTIVAMLSLRFENPGKTYPKISLLHLEISGQEAARLPFVSGKTYLKFAHTPLYRLKTSSQQVAMVLTALVEGLDPSAAERVFGYRQATITRLSDSRWRVRTDLARALLLPSPAPVPPVGRTAHQAAQLPKGSVAVASNRSLHEASPRASSESPHKNAAHIVIHSLRQLLAASRSSPVMG